MFHGSNANTEYVSIIDLPHHESLTTKGEKNMDGGEAIAAGQHRRAS